MKKYIIKSFIVAMCLLSILPIKSLATESRSGNQEEIEHDGIANLIEIKEKNINKG